MLLLSQKFLLAVGSVWGGASDECIAVYSGVFEDFARYHMLNRAPRLCAFLCCTS